MKKIIRLIVTAITAFNLSSISLAQDNQVKATSIKGSYDITFNTRTETDAEGKLKKGVTDVYSIALNVDNSAKFSGQITHLPPVFSSVLGREEQGSQLSYKLDLDLVNPANPAQTKRIGRMVGTVPIDKTGAYQFGKGTLMVGVDAAGKASGFESKFRGVALGKPPKNNSKLAGIKKDAVQITRNVQGKNVTVVVKDYDKMTFQNLVMSSGPVQTYPEITVNGEMLYDYERTAWYFRNVSLTSLENGKDVVDKLTGNIRWVESPQRIQNGEGEYQFDVRVNEPEAKDATAVFAGANDESAFFETDSGVAALTGSVKYKDTFSGSGTETVIQSKVTIDLVGNKLTRSQTMALAKLLCLTSVVPMNAD